MTHLTRQNHTRLKEQGFNLPPYEPPTTPNQEHEVYLSLKASLWILIPWAIVLLAMALLGGKIAYWLT